MNGEDSKDKKALEETMPLRSNLQLLQEIQQMLKDSSAEELDVDALEALLAELDEQAPVELDHDPEELMQKGEVPDENNIPKRPADERREVRWFEYISFPRRFFKVAACFLLVFSLCGSTVAMAHPEIVEAVVGWFREIVGTTTKYEDSGQTVATDHPAATYRPGWLPDGYEEASCHELSSGVDILYFNEEGLYISFTCSSDPASSALSVNWEHCDLISTKVGATPADLYMDRREGELNVLVWTKGNTLFCVGGMLTEEELLRIAENIVKVSVNTEKYE